MIDVRLITLKAIACVLRFAEVAMRQAQSMSSGKRVIQFTTCIPPKLPPMRAFRCVIPSSFSSMRKTSTASSKEYCGKDEP